MDPAISIGEECTPRGTVVLSRADQPPDVHPARYTGHATSNQISITLTILDMAVPEQTFTLKRGADARVFRCL